MGQGREVRWSQARVTCDHATFHKSRSANGCYGSFAYVGACRWHDCCTTEIGHCGGVDQKWGKGRILKEVLGCVAVNSTGILGSGSAAEDRRNAHGAGTECGSQP